MFNKDIKFKYSWRPYQEKVLKEFEKYVDDKKINFVLPIKEREVCIKNNIDKDLVLQGI